ncbi:MAG: hypothetical protein KatS3mg109_0144 [Pirellulaceae bacterium]|nr:MAG: hypothetical protein KatS3mg109_0144 [Pirellulaceae bacterium]
MKAVNPRAVEWLRECINRVIANGESDPVRLARVLLGSPRGFEVAMDGSIYVNFTFFNNYIQSAFPPQPYAGASRELEEAIADSLDYLRRRQGDEKARGVSSVYYYPDDDELRLSGYISYVDREPWSHIADYKVDLTSVIDELGLSDTPPERLREQLKAECDINLVPLDWVAFQAEDWRLEQADQSCILRVSGSKAMTDSSDHRDLADRLSPVSNYLIRVVRDYCLYYLNLIGGPLDAFYHMAAASKLEWEDLSNPPVLRIRLSESRKTRELTAKFKWNEVFELQTTEP